MPERIDVHVINDAYKTIQDLEKIFAYNGKTLSIPVVSNAAAIKADLRHIFDYNRKTVNLKFTTSGLKDIEKRMDKIKNFDPTKGVSRSAKGGGKSSGGKAGGIFAGQIATYEQGAIRLRKAITQVNKEIAAAEKYMYKNAGALDSKQIGKMKSRVTELRKVSNNMQDAYNSTFSKNPSRKISDAKRNQLQDFLTQTDKAVTGSRHQRALYDTGLSKYAATMNKDVNSIVSSLTSAQNQIRNQMAGLQKVLTSSGRHNLGDNDIARVRNEFTKLQTSLREIQSLQAQIPANGARGNGILGDANLAQQVDRVTQSYQRATAAAKNLSAEMNGRMGIASAMENQMVYFDKMGAKMSDYFSKFGHNLQKNTQLYDRFLTLQNKASRGQFASIGDANRQWAQFRTDARAAGVEIDTFGSKLERTFGSRVRSATAGMGVFALMGTVRDIVQNARDVDSAMTELKKVTNETDATYTKFLDNAGTRAQKLGATLQETVSATADFARLGFNVDDATKLADNALIYENVGDDVENIDQASQALISTMQGFGIEAENSSQIVDKFNEVANNYASSAGDIGEITKRSAAAMSAAGNTLDQTIALGVAANEVQQDADTVGTALKTMSMRLRGSKTDVESAGLDAEGMATSVSKLRDEIMSLSGVDIMLDKDTFKSSYDILMGIGEVWDGLTDVNRANITELLFGKRQANIGTAILQNYERAQDILETSQNSEGSALRENEVYLSSIQGHLDQLAAKWETFSVALAKSSGLKALIDFGGGIVSVFTQMTQTFGSATMVLTPLIAAMSKASNVGLFKTYQRLGANGEITQEVGSFVTANKEEARVRKHDTELAHQENSARRDTYMREVSSLDDATERMAAYDRAMEHTTADGQEHLRRIRDIAEGTSDVAERDRLWGEEIRRNNEAHQARIEQMNKESRGFKGFSKATSAMFGNIGASLAIGAGIELAMKGIEAVDKSAKISAGARKEAMEQTIDSYNKATQSATDNKKTIQSLSSEYKTLAQGVDSQGRNISLTADEFARYNDIVDQLVDISPSLIKGYNKEGHAIIDRNSAIEDAIKLQDDYAEAATRRYTSNDSMRDIIRGARVDVKDALQDSRKSSVELGKAVGLDARDRSTITSERDLRTDEMSIKHAKEIDDVLGHQVDLQRASSAELDEILEKRGEILKNTEQQAKADGLSAEQVQGRVDKVSEALDTLSANQLDVDSATQPVMDALQVYASQINDETGKSIMDGLPEAMQDGYNAGLKAIAKKAVTDENFGEGQAKTAAQNLVDEMSDVYNSSQYRNIMSQVQKAQEEFMSGDRNKAAVEKYKNDVAGLQDQLQGLASQFEGTNAAMFEGISQMAIDVGNFGQENILSLANAFNPLKDKIDEARDAKTRFDEAMSGGDYNTAINAQKEIYDAMTEGTNDEGNGTMAFWTGAEEILGKGTLRDLGYDIDSVKTKLQEWAPAMKDTEAGTDALFNQFAKYRDTLNEIDGVNIAEDGSWDIPAEKYAEVARQLGISEDLLVSMVDNARHWADVKLWDSPEKAVSAIKDMESTYTDAEGKAYAFYDTVESEARQAGLSGQELTDYMSEIGKQVELIDLQKLDFDAGTEKGKKNIKEVADQLIGMNSALDKNGKLDLTGTTAMFKQMGKSADETTHALEQFDAAGLLDMSGYDMSEFGGDLSQFVAQAFGELDTNNPFAGMESSVDSMATSINNLVATLGGVPEDWLHIDGQLAKIDEATSKGREMSQEEYDSARKTWQEERAHQREILKNSKDQNQRRQASANIERLNKSGQALEKQAYQNGLTTDEEFERRMSGAGADQRTTQHEEEASALRDLSSELNEASKAGAKFGETQHGNIEQGKGERQVLEWTSDALANNQKALESWYDTSTRESADAARKDIQERYGPHDGKNTISTVDMMSGTFEEEKIPIAFTPLLQTESGQPVVLDRNNLTGYMHDVISTAQQITETEGGSLFDNIMKIDASPVDYLGEKWQQNGNLIHGIIADVGDTAEQTAKQLHFIGDDGSVAMSFQNVERAAQQADMSVSDYIQSLSSSQDEANQLNDAYMNYLAMRQDEYSSMLPEGTGQVSIEVTADVSQFEASLDEVEGLSGEQHEAVIKGVVEFEQSGGSNLEELTSTLQQLPPEVRTSVIAQLKESGNQSLVDYAETLDELPPDVVTNATVETLVNYLTGSQEPPEDGNASVGYDDVSNQAPPEDGSASVGYDEVSEQAPPEEGTAPLHYTYGGQDEAQSGTATLQYDGGGAPTLDGTANYTANFDSAEAPPLAGLISYTGDYSSLVAPLLSGTASYTTSGLPTVAPTIHGVAVYTKEFKYKGSSNRRRALSSGTSDRRRFHSAASGKLGPTGQGGLTLTGELGPELVWLPDENASFLTGVSGPQIQDLPANAVVWPYEETKRIFGGTLPPGALSNRHSMGRYAASHLGSSAKGANYQFGSAGSGNDKKKTWGYYTDKYYGKSKSKKKLNYLESQYDLEQISEATYYNRLRALYTSKKKKLKGAEKKKAQKDLHDAYTDLLDAQSSNWEDAVDMGTMSEATYYKNLSAQTKRFGKGKYGKQTKAYKEHLKALHDAYNDMLDAQIDSLDHNLTMGTITEGNYFNNLLKMASKYTKAPKNAGKFTKEYKEYQEKVKEAADAVYDREKREIDFMLGLGVNNRGARYTAVNAYRDLQSYIRRAMSGIVKSNISTRNLTSKSYVKRFVYSGTPNRRQPIPSMSRGGRLGPSGRGGLTLTGELGPELVWLPDDDISFVVGLGGPEMIDLPSNAVVWPNDETQAIFGDTINSNYLEPDNVLSQQDLEWLEEEFVSGAHGINFFGSASLGTRDKKKQTGGTNPKYYKPKKKKKKKNTTTQKKKKKKKEVKPAFKPVKSKNKKAPKVWNPKKKKATKKKTSSKKKSSSPTTWDMMSEEQRQQALQDLKDARQEAYDYLSETSERTLNNSLVDNWGALNNYIKDSINNLKTLDSLEDYDKIIDARQDVVNNFFSNLNEKFDDVKEKISDHDLFGDWGVDESPITLLTEYKKQLIQIYQANRASLEKDTDAAKQYQALLKEVERELKNAQKETKNQFDDIFKLVEQLIRREKQDLIDALDKQKDKYDDIISKKKESLQLTEDELSYQDDLADYAKEEAKLRQKIAALSRDNSREAKAQMADYQEQLSELLDERNRTVRQETLSRTNDTLDKQQEKYDEFVDKLKETIQDFLDNQELVNSAVYDAIDNRETNHLLQRLYDYNAQYGDGLLQTVEEWQMDLADVLAAMPEDIVSSIEAVHAELINVVGYGDDSHLGRFTDEITSMNHMFIDAFVSAADTLSQKYYKEGEMIDTLIEKYDKLINKMNDLINGKISDGRSSGNEAEMRQRLDNILAAHDNAKVSKDAVAQAKSAAKSAQEKAASADDSVRAKQNAVNQAQTSQAAALKAVQNTQATIKRLKAQVAIDQKAASEKTEKYLKVKNTYTNVKEEQKSASAIVNDLNKQIKTAKDSLDKAKKNGDKVSIQRATGTLKGLEQQLGNAKNRLKKANAQLANAKSNLTTAKKAMDAANAKTAASRKLVTNNTAILKNEKTNLTNANQALASAQAALAKAQSDAKTYQNAADAANKEIQTAEANYQAANEYFQALMNQPLANADQYDVLQNQGAVLTPTVQAQLVSDGTASSALQDTLNNLASSIDNSVQNNTNNAQTFNFAFDMPFNVGGNMDDSTRAQLESEITNAVYAGINNALRAYGISVSTSSNALKN